MLAHCRISGIEKRMASERQSKSISIAWEILKNNPTLARHIEQRGRG
jgi:hypothetical protein